MTKNPLPIAIFFRFANRMRPRKCMVTLFKLNFKTAYAFFEGSKSNDIKLSRVLTLDCFRKFFTQQ